MKKTAIMVTITGSCIMLLSINILAEKGEKFSLKNQPASVQPVSPENPVEVQSQEATLTENNPAEGEEINWQVLSGGGITDCSGGGFRLGGTIGQLAAGISTTTGHNLYHGFWQSFGAGGCDCFPGDANNDLVVDVGDAVYIMNYIFREGDPAIPYALCSGDAQADCFCNVGDVVYIINYAFREGPYPYSCQTWLESCGPVIHK